MSWFKVDDGFYDHPKIMEAGNTAVGAYVRGGAYCARQLTDGYVSRAISLTICTRSIIKRLISTGLWLPVKGGYQMHDYLKYNPSREQVLAERKAAAQRQRDARNRRNSHGVTHSVTNGVTDGNVTRESHRDGMEMSRRESHDPDPTRKEPTSSGVSIGGGGPGGNVAASPPRRGRPPSQGNRLPDDFEVTPAMVEWAREHTPHVNGKFETDQFRDYWSAKTGKDATKKDWVATWRWWMRHAESRSSRSNGHRRPTSEVRFEETENLRERLRKKREFETSQLQLPRGST